MSVIHDKIVWVYLSEKTHTLLCDVNESITNERQKLGLPLDVRNVYSPNHVKANSHRLHIEGKKVKPRYRIHELSARETL